MNHPLQPKALGVRWLPEPVMELWTTEAKVMDRISQVNLNPWLQIAPLVPPAPPAME